MNLTLRVTLGVVYVVVALILTGVYTPTHTVTPTNTDTTGTYSGFAGVETTADALPYRWSGANAQITITTPVTHFVLLTLHATSAHADTVTTISTADHVIARIQPVAGMFRRYLVLTNIPYHISTTLPLNFESTPTTRTDNRELGIAVAQLVLTPLHMQDWYLPPLTWITVIVMSAVSIAMLQWMWAIPRYAYVALLVGAIVLPVMVVLIGKPLRTWQIGAIGIACAVILSISASRMWVQQRRSSSTIRILYRWSLHLLLAITTLICLWVVWSLWPMYGQHGTLFRVIYGVIVLVFGWLMWQPQRMYPTWVRTSIQWMLPLVTMAILAIYAHSYVRQINGAMQSDLPYHLDDARYFATGQALVRYMVWVDGHAQATTSFYAFNWHAPIPHPLLHMSTGLVALLIHDTWFLSAFPVTLIVYQIISMLMLFVIVRRFAGNRVHWVWVWVGMLSIWVSTAVYIPALNPFIYKGQGGIIIVHNATTIITRPVTWAALWVSVAAIASPPRYPRVYLVVAATLLCVLAALGKPNAPLAFVPAMLVVLVGTYIVHPTPAKALWWWMIPIVCVAVVLAIQSTIRSNGGSDFAIDWMRSALLSSPYPVISVIQLTALPLVCAFVAPWIWRDRFVQLLGVTFIVALAQYWIFSEPADLLSNNFAWGMRILIPALYAVAIGIVLRLYQRPDHTTQRWYTRVLVLLAGVHLLSGVLYLWQISFGTSYL